MACCNFPLPAVLLSVSGDVFGARSPEGYRPQWRIRAEAETETAARTIVSLDERIVADVTVHAAHESQLPDEVQALAAAILWSAPAVYIGGGLGLAVCAMDNELMCRPAHSLGDESAREFPLPDRHEWWLAAKVVRAVEAMEEGK